MPNDPKSFLSTDGLQALIANIKASLGATDYDDLSDKPKLNNVTVQGNKTSTDFGLQDKIDNSHKLNADLIDDSESINKFATAAEKTAWNAKQDAISDLSTIRSGAAAGATAIQQSDVSSTYSASGTAPVNGTAVNTAIETLDVSSVGGSGKYISAIKEVDGKIFATPETMDTTPTANSTVPVTSGGVAASQAAQQSEINYAVNAGAKNFCPKETETSTGSGFTSDVPVNIPAGTYILSFTGTLAYTASLSLYKALPHSGNSLASISLSAQTGEQSIEFTISETAKYIAFYHNGSGNSLTNIMIRPAAITDQTFVPYAKTNRELTVENSSQQSEINYAVNTGAKNLFQNKKNAGAIVVKNGATWSFDQTSMEAVVSGTVGSTWSDLYLLESNFDLSDKEYKIVIETDSSNLFMYIPDNTLSGGNIPANGQYYAGVYKYKGVMTTTTRFTAKSATYSGNSIRCMVCPASITDSTFVPYAKTNRELTVAEADDRSALAEVIDGGAAGTKNLLDCSLQSIKAVTQNSVYGFSWNGNVCTSTRGVSFTINADNSITVAANTQYEVWFKLTDFMYSAGSYVISGCPTNGSTGSYYIESDALNYKDLGNGVSFTINSTTTDSIYIVVKPGQTFEKTFYPMLCSKVLYDADPSYVPYAPALTNITLTPAAIKAVDDGAKNLLRITASSQVVGGVTFTVNADGTIIANGTKTNNDWLYLSTGNSLAAGTYVLSSGLAPQSDVSLKLLIATADSLGSAIMSAEGARQVHIKQLTSDYTGLYYAIRISSGTTVNNIVFKPMLCAASDYAVSPKFVPYRPSWQEMWEIIQALQNNS